MAAFDQNGPTAVGGKQLERCFISVSLGDRLQRDAAHRPSGKDKDDLLGRPRLDWIVGWQPAQVPQRGMASSVQSDGTLEETEAVYAI